MVNVNSYLKNSEIDAVRAMHFPLVYLQRLSSYAQVFLLLAQGLLLSL
jgi:hypothetical protein